jgi:hypothetical protein
MPEITLFRHDRGPLTKRFELGADGKVVKTTAARMCSGNARRVQLSGVRDLAEFIGKVASNEAHTHGSLRADLPPEVCVTTKRRLNGNPTPDLIARTKEFVGYGDGDGFVLIDFDESGMPLAVRERISRAGGLWPALCEVMPELKTAALVTRPSTSAGIYRRDTGESMGASKNEHIYLHIKKVADAVRFLQALHDRCWLAGLGWFTLGRSGQLLERSVIDRAVGNPERLVFEGPPQLTPPLMQSAAARKPQIVEGEIVDTVVACPPLTILEKSRKAESQAKAKQPLGNAAAKRRNDFVVTQGEELAKRKGISRQAAQDIIRRMGDGILRPDVMLEFDDPEPTGNTVGDILADPEKYAGETLADPLEGIDYGRCKAMVMVRDDGTPWIHSFAHGRTIYELRHDTASVRAAIEQARQTEVMSTFVAIMRNADITSAEEETVVALVHQHTGQNVRSIKRTLKAARQDAERAREAAQYERRLAERDDPRPLLTNPLRDAPWLPVMAVLNEVLAAAEDRIPPARNIEGHLARAQRLKIPDMHLFVGGNEGSDITGESPPQMAIKILNETAAAELIERHIEHADEKGRPVHLNPAFVSHYMCREDGALPIMAAVATMPMVSADGHLIYSDGLDRKRGIAFDVGPEIMKVMPARKECGPDAVAAAMDFLTDEWLCDVATDYAGKCTLVALALTIIQRTLLDSRPVFFITAGRRGGGKTTALQMIIQAVTGTPAAAAAWSPNDEERRKALMSYLLMGVPYILWDNIPRGLQVICPHIERACTSSVYSDRKLTVSEIVQAASSAVHTFTGNNIGPKGDLASRALHVRLTVDRVDPENRQFKHQDPIGWTQANRGKILHALFIVLLGNPQLDLPANAAVGTRFKLWQRLVGSAVEHAAQCAAERDPDCDIVLPDKVLDFAKLFLTQEGDDEESADLADCLNAITKMFVTTLSANDLSFQLCNTHTENTAIVREFLFPGTVPDFKPTPKAIAKRLNARVDDPVRHGERTLTLKSKKDDHTKVLRFWVETK